MWPADTLPTPKLYVLRQSPLDAGLCHPICCLSFARLAAVAAVLPGCLAMPTSLI